MTSKKFIRTEYNATLLSLEQAIYKLKACKAAMGKEKGRLTDYDYNKNRLADLLSN